MLGLDSRLDVPALRAPSELFKLEVLNFFLLVFVLFVDIILKELRIIVLLTINCTNVPLKLLILSNIYLRF